MTDNPTIHVTEAIDESERLNGAMMQEREESESDVKLPSAPGRYTYYDSGLLPIVHQKNPDLRQLLKIYQIEGVDKPYWTDQLLRHILNADRISEELQRDIYGLEPEQIRWCVNRIYPQESIKPPPKACLRLFALLLLAQTAPCFVKFLEEGVSDEDLPFKIEVTEPLVYGSKNPKKHLTCFDGWSWGAKDLLIEFQRCLMVPHFGFDEKGKAREVILLNKRPRPWLKSEERPEAEGGFGKVKIVHIHPTCHSFDTFDSSPDESQVRSNQFAIKTIKKEKKKDNVENIDQDQRIRKELELLKWFSGSHPHIITLLGAFKYKETWNFILPKARYNLDEYLTSVHKTPEWDHETVIWASEQLHGLMGALNEMHNPTNQHLRPGPEKFARHSDIKGDNILCFPPKVGGKVRIQSSERGPLLVLADFGLSELRSANSRSGISNRWGALVPGFRPPECDLEGKELSRAFDIWTIGCLFLEMATWLLGGAELLERFRKTRVTTHITGTDNDIFYVIKRLPAGGNEVAVQVKPEVTNWISMLHGLKPCPLFVHELLDMIESQMLVVLGEGHLRVKSEVLVRDLERMKSACAAASYAEKGVDDPNKTKPTVLAVQAKLREQSRKQLLASNRQLETHHGETRRSLAPEESEKHYEPERSGGAK